MDNFNYVKDERTFKFLLETLKDSIKSWDYFVNWDKVYSNVKEVEIELNILNYLVGKDNIKNEFRYLLEEHPEIIRTIPILIACREQNFEILSPKINDAFNTEMFTFVQNKRLSEDDIEKAISFAENSGILNLFKTKTIKNVVDYVFGIEVGLDSNGRKNRSGTAMELLVETFIRKLCSKHGWSYLRQATPKAILEKFDYNVTVDRTSRSFDFAINTGKKLYLVETNYYGGGGSKLKATAGEYKTLYDVAASDGNEFIWITDGKGWLTANRPLQETFNHNKYIINLKMIELGVLEGILLGNI